MGTSLIRACCETLSHASMSSGSRRLEDLTVEVDEARKENQRLNRQVQTMRRALKEGVPDAVASSYRASQGPLNADARQLEQMLSQLQQENAQLRAGPRHLARGRPSSGGSGVSLSKYQALQQQVHDLQRVAQMPAAAVPGSSYSYRGSRHASGRETPMSGLSSPHTALRSGPSDAGSARRPEHGVAALARAVSGGRRLQKTAPGNAARERHAAEEGSNVGIQLRALPTAFLPCKSQVNAEA
ncbi:unnamed protein product [Effrenium voratum]|nr:unnamed protein product [Effrenium voratum]